jgi:two-component system sensor histidine kinase QseC
MSRWWQASLVRRVVLALLAAFLLVWCVLIGIDYLEYRAGTQRRAGLELLASNIVESIPAGDAGQAVAVVKAAEAQYNRLRKSSTSADVGEILLRLEQRDGTPLYASSAAGAPGIPGAAPYPERLDLGSHPYWSAVQESGAWRLQVLEPVIDDSLIVRLLGGELLLPMLIAFPLVLIPLWFAVHRGLWPLRRLVESIKARAADDFTPLSLSLKYAELQPLVTAFNHLLETACQGMARERAFVQDAAHELRTPLAVVSAQAHLLASSDDPGAQAEARQALERAVQRASHLVHQLLTLAALEGSSQRAEQAVDLVEITRGILIAASPTATAKGIEVALESPDELHAKLDTTAFHSVLGNLLDNALAYCPAGALVTVGLNIDEDAICLTVVDNGPGVSAADLPRLCERFFRGSGVTSSGSGLGLPIVQQAIKRLAGRLSVAHGADGRGLVVSVWLPAA